MISAIRCIQRGHKEYPLGLERLKDPPSCIYLRGQLPSWERAVAVVGTRNATSRGEAIARSLAASLAKEGCVVVSGGARGIDRAAHEGALESGGITVVVHASGLNAIPKSSLPFLRQVLEMGGLEVSELPEDARPRRHTFLARNRLIAALAQAVVVVEAPIPSGALSTAAHALALGIPLFSVPRVPSVFNAEGSNALLRKGARVCLGPEDVLEVLDARHEALGSNRLQQKERREHKQGTKQKGLAKPAPNAPPPSHPSLDGLCQELGQDLK
ncbi:MAG: DNA-processing protein DprA, partial [Deltaproteobacteria bacterium]|nr:DNA-processing protein DprA [Deltaproteobacteria bacterium]